MLNLTRIYLSHKLQYRLLQKRLILGRGKLLMIAKLLIPKPRGATILYTIFGFKLLVDPILDRGIERSIYYKGYYEPGTFNIFSSILEKGDIVIDAGANIGLMTLYLSKLIGQNGEVHAFEPNPTTYSILKKNVRINYAKNIKLYRSGLGSGTSLVRLYPNWHINRGAASIVKQDDTEGVEVSINALDFYLKSKIIGKVKFLKVDVEGYELELLKGARNLLESIEAPMICIEYNDENLQSSAEVLDLYYYLKEVNDYKIYRFSESKYSISWLRVIGTISDLPKHDNLFCFLPKHLAKLKRENKWSNIFEKDN